METLAVTGYKALQTQREMDAFAYERIARLPSAQILLQQAPTSRFRELSDLRKFPNPAFGIYATTINSLQVPMEQVVHSGSCFRDPQVKPTVMDCFHQTNIDNWANIVHAFFCIKQGALPK